MIFRDILKKWNEKNRQNYFWRACRTIYHIWIAEIIFQQTRIIQGEKYYKNFIARFPTVEKLAEAERDDVLKVWQGLGYYSRALNLHKAAKIIAIENNGQFPASYAEWLKMPGVGPYTAAAIASIGLDEKIPAIDGNVKRIVSRWLKIEIPMETASFYYTVYNFLLSEMPEEKPGWFNEAMMDFGATYCVPQNPDCKNCPMLKKCGAGKKGQAEKFPLKKKATAKKEKTLVYFVFCKKGSIMLRKRGGNDLWKHMYDFPSFETEGHLEKISSDIKKKFIPKSVEDIIEYNPVFHQLTHISFKIFFVQVCINEKALLPDNCIEVPIENTDQYAKPRPVEKFLDPIKNTYLCVNK